MRLPPSPTTLAQAANGADAEACRCSPYHFQCGQDLLVTDEPTKPSGAVEARFDWSADEFVEVMQHLSRERLRSRGWRMLLGLAGVVVAWQLFQALFSDDIVSGAVTALPWIVLIVFWTWALTRGTAWLAARRVKKLDPRVTGQQLHRIDREGLFADAGGGTVLLPWSEMSRTVETPSFFLWYRHGKVAQYTPKRALSEADIERVRALVRELASAQA